MNTTKGHAMNLTYFAADGSYGDASSLVVVDTSDWADDDWDMVQEARDSERSAIAVQISRSSDAQLTLFEN